jgi:ribosomal-protein-alanine N-acetyltransferase
MRIKIQDADPSLLERLYDIEKKSFSEEAFTRSQISILLKDRNAIAFAAFLGEEVAGFIIALVEEDHGKPFGHIVTIDVSPPQRQKGVGKQLLQAVELELRRKGIEECWLEVRENNVAASTLYSKNGYANMGKLEKYYGKSHGLRMRKFLNCDSTVVDSDALDL